MVGSRRGNTGDHQFVKFPSSSSFSCWNTTFQTGVCSGSSHHTAATQRIREIELAKSIDDLEKSKSISGLRLLMRGSAQHRGRQCRAEASGRRRSPWRSRNLNIRIESSVDVRSFVRCFDKRWDEDLLLVRETSQDHLLESI